MDVAGILVGAVASRFVVKALNKAMPTASPTIKALVPVGAGVFLATQKNPLIRSAGFVVKRLREGPLEKSTQEFITNYCEEKGYKSEKTGYFIQV